MGKKKLNRKKLNPQNPIFTGIKYTDDFKMQLFSYTQSELNENNNFYEKDYNGFKDDSKQYWLNTHAIHDVAQIYSICKKTGVHDLVIQDILDVNQRPKFQQYEDYIFFSIKSLLPTETIEIEAEQLSFILGKNFLISFQERKADHFEHVRHRLRENIGILRERTTDYLLFLLLESILDNYFKTIDSIEDKVESFALIDINEDPSPELLNTIEVYKRQLHFIKKTIIPIRDFATKIEREQHKLIQQKHIKYFFEIKDICLTLLDNCDKIEARLESNINLFFSIQGHRMNQVMKTLTVVSTIFIPLTFLAGIYGMNFTNIPELSWKWGYFGFWLIILVIFILMLFYFRRKKWF
ncbi:MULTISPECIES: magnesium/cobalt transporter CorA [Flavobacteriaceae]|uniref:Magnesium transport protein CorA n=2 Tax=Flavobacteriaceae TaxID=49546 RepID=A0A4Y8ARM4_9FLAO|nr:MULTISPECIES: magnesium/cobalt transporter CorA [Flavobacteriaceae]TEW72900.1 magnesium/cobalt transporter CorA [Gramella jeungdoensis]GGK48725.1 magnesium transport protein CorA [Lutibacter litoralis]